MVLNLAKPFPSEELHCSNKQNHFIMQKEYETAPKLFTYSKEEQRSIKRPFCGSSFSRRRENLCLLGVTYVRIFHLGAGFQVLGSPSSHWVEIQGTHTWL